MRKLIMILAVSLVGGCAGKQLPQTLNTPHVYNEIPATSLAFSPPIAQGEPAVMLPRDQRQPGVFIGFEDVTTSYFYLRTDDRMTNDGTDHYVRRAIVEKIGVSYR
jgi:hypothetical protein